MVVSRGQFEISRDDLNGDDILASSDHVLGNAAIDTIQNIVYVKLDQFDKKNTPQIAQHIDKINAKLIRKNLDYLLIGFGRWGSSDPWLGIPVNWSQISGAKIIVECNLPDMTVELSQGSHFFHNLSSFKVCYFSLSYHREYEIDWEWLNGQSIIEETEFVRHVEIKSPLTIRVDGRSGRGYIKK